VPFTPYHFGPCGFIGLVFRKWLDIPVFVLANVVVDIEVLIITIFGLGYPRHRYCHTFLVGAVLGLLWGAAAYPLRGIFKRLMQSFRIPYQPSFWKMLLSGVLGVWLHVLIDGIYHWDIRPFWPARARLLYHLLTRRQIETVCLACLAAAFVVYMILLGLSYRSRAQQPGEKDELKL
jgi:membrane-bound metal-dependent hydrolase YbcI (DUF457 family)